MALHEHKPGHFTVQASKKDPLRELPDLRLCRRVAGLEAARKQEAEFLARAEAWATERRLIKEARSRGLVVASPSQPSSATGFSDFLEKVYLPWARAGHLDPRTMSARRSTFMILAEDLGNTALADVEARVSALVEQWRAEGCRLATGKDRLGRQLNRQPRPISDPGINERLKILRAILGHAHMQARLLAARPRIPLIKRKRAAVGAGRPVRYFTDEERVAFPQPAGARTATSREQKPASTSARTRNASWHATLWSGANAPVARGPRRHTNID